MIPNTVVHEDLTGDQRGVRVIRISRPQARNALDTATKDLLMQMLSDADADPEVRAIVLTGTGGVFVAGTDLKQMKTLAPADHLVQRTGQMFSVLDALETPVVAAVEGYALGGGCELAMACDVVIAGASAQFGQPEIRVGLIPGAGGLSRLVQRAGRSRALHLVLTGDRIDATTAQELGIVADIVPDGTALGTSVELAARIAAQPPLQVQAIRRVARHAENSPLRTAIELERTTFQLLFDTADRSEGIQAFLDKRTPNYQGK
ncbi:enoyl-CoA hydratase-related protein [Nocardia pseudovaccinii]|uniref:enoyl-CoA hydratase-related protein n=1 Tax=Nocardia pseudovaccinii TaxID=189540 RepID=UPI0007A37C45|nr:enoyl-CoA hydratase-related protein [Nocardia pseudovaccinii]